MKKHRYCRICDELLTKRNKYRSDGHPIGNICYRCFSKSVHKSLNMPCRVCNVPLTSSNIYKARQNGKKCGYICYSCHIKTKKWYYIRRTKNVILYIEERNYPSTWHLSEASTEDTSGWRKSRMFFNIPTQVDGVWMLTPYMEFLCGREFLESHPPAKDGHCSKVGSRVETTVYVKKHGEWYQTFQHQVCDGCGSDEMRIDERGYKYCTNCFLMEE